jgi:acetyl-CoA acetyltransferase
MYSLSGTSGVITNREKCRPYFNTFTDDVLKMFGYAFGEHQAKYGTSSKQAAKVAFKNHKHSVHNPHASMRKEFTMEEIENSPKLCGDITVLQAW